MLEQYLICIVAFPDRNVLLINSNGGGKQKFVFTIMWRMEGDMHFALQNPRLLCERKNPVEGLMDFFKRYRFTKQGVEDMQHSVTESREAYSSCFEC